jgi:hypothetical protein
MRGSIVAVHFGKDAMRPSTLVFAGAGLLFAVASLATIDARNVGRDFSAKTTIVMGRVLDNGAMLRSSRHSNSEWFCWVEYEFTPPGAAAHRNWRLWEPACGVSEGRPIPIQDVVANPDLNRPAGSEPRFPSSRFFFAAGVAVVVGFLLRGSEPSDADPLHLQS